MIITNLRCPYHGSYSGRITVRGRDTKCPRCGYDAAQRAHSERLLADITPPPAGAALNVRRDGAHVMPTAEDRQRAGLPPIEKPRLGDWMQTCHGRQYWPLDPRAEDVSIFDIADALAKLCRYGGHCRQFYSVAEHCVLMAFSPRCPPEQRLAALMHDASEAYLVDIPRPIKKHLAGYADIEDRNMRVIAEKFGFSWPMPAAVKMLDEAILLDEQAQAMAPPPAPWGIAGEPLGVRLQFWRPIEAAEKFLSAFFQFGGKA
jgi:hypothetical protein